MRADAGNNIVQFMVKVSANILLFPTAEVPLAENNFDVQVRPSRHLGSACYMESHSLLCAKYEYTDNMRLDLLMTDIRDSPDLLSSSR